MSSKGVKMEKLIEYRGNIYVVKDNGSNELILCKKNKPDYEIHIAKDSKRYEDIMKGDVENINGVSNIQLVNAKKSIYDEITNSDIEITDDDYDLETGMSVIYEIATSKTKGKHSTKDLIKNELEKKPEMKIPFMYMLVCYAERNTTKNFINYELIERMTKKYADSNKVFKSSDYNNFLDFKDIVESIDGNVDYEMLLSLIPSNSKYHIVTALCGFNFSDNLNLTKKDCNQLIEDISAGLNSDSDF